MDILVHAVILLAAGGIVWLFAGVLLEAVNRIARRFCRTGFFTAFFVLGFLTSISEISVAANSGLAGVPQVSVGNLVGASFVILLFIVPFLAVAGRSIELNSAVSRRNLALLLAAVVLPAVLVIDGNVTRTEGMLALLAYGAVAYMLYRQRRAIAACDIAEERRADASGRRLAKDLVTVVLGGLGIFAGAHFLVGEAVYFAGLLSIPASLVGLLLLSIGTNLPEIAIAIRSVLARKADVALGDYLGSAAMNTLIFGGLALATGPFGVEASEFIMTTALFVFGLVLLYVFARSRYSISRGEGAMLPLFYAAFVLLQFANVFRFATD